MVFNILLLKDQHLISLLLEYSDVALREIRDYAVGQNLMTLRNRVNELGFQSPLFKDKVLIELLFNCQVYKIQLQQKRLLVKLLILEFRLEANSRTSPLRKEEFNLKVMNIQLLFLKKLLLYLEIGLLTQALVLMKVDFLK